jgi:hypothetical protein
MSKNITNKGLTPRPSDIEATGHGNRAGSGLCRS